MRGKVEKIIPPIVPTEPEKAQISVDEAEDLYREIRVENVVTDDRGEKARLKQGASRFPRLQPTGCPFRSW